MVAIVGRVGRREDHAAARARRARPARRGHAAGRRARTCSRSPEAGAARSATARSASSSSSTTCCRSSRALENVEMPLRIARAPGGRGAAAAPRRCSSGSGSPSAPSHRPGRAVGRRAAAGGGGPRAGRCAPALLLADEPTGNLDRATGERLHEPAAASSTARYGLTSVIATHNERLAAACDRVLRLEGGRLVAGLSARGLRTAASAGVLRYDRMLAGATVVPAGSRGRGADVRTVHRTGPAGSLLRPLRGQPARQHLDRDRAPAARPDPRGQGPDPPHLRRATCRSRTSARKSRAARSSARRSRPRSRSRFSAETKRVLQFAAEEADGCCTTTSAPSTSCSASCARSGRVAAAHPDARRGCASTPSARTSSSC